ncbi:MAG: hypothetical protein KTR31_22730 [Myxococcales bacterium]|nr:hypothetical protein [Myxococcales bacterium]
MNASRGLFATAAVLWVIWGVVHLIAGLLTMANPAGQAVAGIADAVDPALITSVEYHPAVGAIVDQHGWNLAWIGLGTILPAVGVWRGRLWAIGLSALLGGMADLGYFIFMDLGGHVHFVPGTVMTIVSSAAILSSALGVYLGRDGR